MLNRLWLASLVLVVAACEAQPTVVPVASTSPATMTVEPQVTAPPATGWVEYRDARYEYGLALPCFWVVNPTPAEGEFGVMTGRSFTDDYFAAHSERGVWINDTWPAGAMKLDVIVTEGWNGALALEDAVRAFYAKYANEQEIVSLESRPLGRGEAVLATVRGGLQGGETVRLVYTWLEPGTLMSFIFVPDYALESADASAILNSLAPTAADSVAFPTNPPAGPPEGATAACLGGG
jgi:hypothetical protein